MYMHLLYSHFTVPCRSSTHHKPGPVFINFHKKFTYTQDNCTIATIIVIIAIDLITHRMLESIVHVFMSIQLQCQHYIVVNTCISTSAVWNIMHKCSNHIQHEGEARGLCVVMHECIIPLVGVCSLVCIPTIVIALQVWYLSLTTGPGIVSCTTGQYPVYCLGSSFDLRHRRDTRWYSTKTAYYIIILKTIPADCACRYPYDLCLHYSYCYLHLTVYSKRLPAIKVSLICIRAVIILINIMSTNNGLKATHVTRMLLIWQVLYVHMYTTKLILFIHVHTILLQ